MTEPIKGAEHIETMSSMILRAHMKAMIDYGVTPDLAAQAAYELTKDELERGRHIDES